MMIKLTYDVLFCTVFLYSLIVVTDAERPNFRSDYIYEKAFAAFYKLHMIAMSWREARIRCEAELGELFIPKTLDEAEALSVLIAQILHKYVGVYVGLHDLYSEGTFVTTNDGRQIYGHKKEESPVYQFVEYQRFAVILPGAPVKLPIGSSLQGTILALIWEAKQPQSVGNCVGIRRSGKLFVYPCEGPLPFVCKVNAETITYYPDCDTFDPAWSLGPTGNCYIRHLEPQPWHQAYSTCNAKGGHLAIINNRTEADFIRDLFKEISDLKVPDNDFAYLGFHDLFRKHHYRTIHGETLEESGYKDWDLKCNRMSQNNDDRRCGGIRRSGLLTTVSCDMPATFFCEKNIKTPSKEALRVLDERKIHTIVTRSSEKPTSKAQVRSSTREAQTHLAPDIFANKDKTGFDP